MVKQVQSKNISKALNMVSTHQITKETLNYAVKYNHNEIVELLVKKKADINAVNNKNIDLVSLAFAFGNKEAIGIFIEYGVDIDSIYPKILFEAVKRKDKELVKKVLDYGMADINQRDDLIHLLFHCF